MARVLVIEDDPSTAATIVTELQRNGHVVDCATDGASGLLLATSRTFDVITLDRMLPELDGLAVATAMRERGISTPILMISALSDVDDRIAGLRAGGDDYLIKPFAPDEMSMRVAALLRRGASLDNRRRLGRLEMDLVRREVIVDDVVVKLLQTEYRLLDFLAENAGRVVSRKLIFEKVWGYHFNPGANLINVHIARLRRKLDRPDRPSMIATVKGEGYRFDGGD